MHKLEVGQLYIPGKTRWPDGIVKYNFSQNQHELRFFFANPISEEVNAIKKDPIEFGLLIQQPVIFLVYKFTNYKKRKVVIDGDAPYSIHLVSDTNRTLPLIPQNENQRVFLQIALIDANTGILKALRGVSLSHNFSVQLTKAIHEQLALPFEKNQYNSIVQGLFQMYPTTDSMFENCEVTCMGGE